MVVDELSIYRGALDKPRLYLGKHDREFDLYDMLIGTVAAGTIGDLEKDGPNEDSAAVIPVGEHFAVLIVADGVGGLAGARRASNLTVETLRKVIAEVNDDNELRLRTAIIDGIEAANQAVLNIGAGSASTLALAEIGPDYVRTYHVGDSILLLCGQRGRVKLLTTPHSPVGFAMEAGLIDENEALEHSELNVIFNVIGSSDMRLEVGSEQPIAPYDTLLLASDGLTDNVFQDEMAATIRTGPLDTALLKLAEMTQTRMGNPSHQPSKPDDFTTLLYRRWPPKRRRKSKA